MLSITLSLLYLLDKYFGSKERGKKRKRETKGKKEGLIYDSWIGFIMIMEKTYKGKMNNLFLLQRIISALCLWTPKEGMSISQGMNAFMASFKKLNQSTLECTDK